MISILKTLGLSTGAHQLSALSRSWWSSRWSAFSVRLRSSEAILVSRDESLPFGENNRNGGLTPPKRFAKTCTLADAAMICMSVTEAVNLQRYLCLAVRLGPLTAAPHRLSCSVSAIISCGAVQRTSNHCFKIAHEGANPSIICGPQKVTRNACWKD